LVVLLEELRVFINRNNGPLASLKKNPELLAAVSRRKNGILEKLALVEPPLQ
jgi:hypothetical protein